MINQARNVLNRGHFQHILCGAGRDPVVNSGRTAVINAVIARQVEAQAAAQHGEHEAPLRPNCSAEHRQAPVLSQKRTRITRTRPDLDGWDQVLDPCAQARNFGLLFLERGSALQARFLASRIAPARRSHAAISPFQNPRDPCTKSSFVVTPYARTKKNATAKIMYTPSNCAPSSQLLSPSSATMAEMPTAAMSATSSKVLNTRVR